MAHFSNFSVNLAECGKVGGIDCAAYRSTLPRYSLISLNLQRMAISGSELISTLNDTVHGH
jgi:hypothetical protein